MAGSIKTNAVQLGDSATDSQNFLLKTNVDGTAKLARGAAGNLGDVLTVPASGAAKIVGALQLAQIVTFQTGAVATGTTTIPTDNTIPQITEGDQYMSLAITPTNALSTLEIDVTWCGSNSVAANTPTVALFQDASANALATCGQTLPTGGYLNVTVFKHVMVAGTTSATTFKIRAGGGTAGTTTFNGSAGGQLYGGVMASRITIKEYLP